MAFFADATLRARLNDAARAAITQRHEGKGYIKYQIGFANIHLDKGLPYADIAWGIDGLDSPVSSEVAQYVESYTLTQSGYGFVRRTEGIYTLRAGGKKKEVLARARVSDYSTDKSEIIVSGAKREDVVKLYELVRDGKVVPDVEVAGFKQIEGGLRELNRLRNRVPQLEQDVTTWKSRTETMGKQLREVREQLAKVQATAAAVK